MLGRITHTDTHVRPIDNQRRQIAQIVANHPGISDAVALVAALGRDDAWIVAANYPFLRAMRLASRRFLFVSDDRSDLISSFRSIVSRLRDGETVVVFPAGGLELDPAL